MRKQFEITLLNKITSEKNYFQLFQNDDWFTTFEKYLTSKGVECNGHYVYIFEDKPVEITNLEEFVQAIDETVFYDIIHKNHDSKEPKTHYLHLKDIQHTLTSVKSLFV